MPRRKPNSKSLARSSAKRSAAATKIYRAAAAAYREGTRLHAAGKIAQATAAFQKADRLLKRAGKSGMDGPVGRLPNPRDYDPRGRCNTCGRTKNDPFRSYDQNGKIVHGCVDDAHTGHLISASASSAWHNRPEAKKIRAAMKAALPRKRRNPAIDDNDEDWYDVEAEAMRLGSQAARAIGHSEREHRKGAKLYNVTWYSPMRGKRTGFMRSIEAHSAADAKRQAKAMVTNDPKATNFVAKEAKRNPGAPTSKTETAYHIALANNTRAGMQIDAGVMMDAVARVWPTAYYYKGFMLLRDALQKAGYKVLNAPSTYKPKKNPGLIDLAANLQAAEFIQDAIKGKRKRKNPLNTYGYDRGYSDGLKGRLMFRPDDVSDSWYVAYKEGFLDGQKERRRKEKKRKPNPSLRDLSETFQGKATGKIEEYKAASAAPANLARTGKLVLFELLSARKAIRVPGAMVAMDTKEKLWLVGPSAPMFKRKAKPGEQLDYGEIKRIIYLTTKAHIEPGKQIEYDHEFEAPRPRLIVDSDGMPVIKGGGYKIRAEGITG